MKAAQSLCFLILVALAFCGNAEGAFYRPKLFPSRYCPRQITEREVLGFSKAFFDALSACDIRKLSSLLDDHVQARFPNGRPLGKREIIEFRKNFCEKFREVTFRRTSNQVSGNTYVGEWVAESRFLRRAVFATSMIGVRRGRDGRIVFRLGLTTARRSDFQLRRPRE